MRTKSNKVPKLEKGLLRKRRQMKSSASRGAARGWNGRYRR